MKVSNICKWLLMVFICSLSYFSVAQDCSPDPNERTEMQEIEAPHHFVSKIIVYRTFGKKYNATGFFISKNVMLGAGHSFREKPFTKVKKLEIRIGQYKKDGEIHYLKKIILRRKDIKIWVHPKFQRGGSTDFDYAMVALNENVVDDFFTIKDIDDLEEINSDEIFISGYPGDKGSNELWLKSIKSDLIQINENVLLYDMYTRVGDSGAPIWCKSKGNYYALGVHGTGSYHNTPCNAGVRLNEENIKKIKSFVLANTL